jgi:hypothetical protein
MAKKSQIKSTRTNIPIANLIHSIITQLLCSQSSLELVQSCQIGWNFPFAWRVEYGGVYNKYDVHELHNLMD